MRAFTVALLFTSMAACGDDAGVVNPNNDTEVDATTADALLSPDLVSVDSASPVDTAAPQDVGSACEPGEGCFNEPCSGPDDCNSGICTMHVGDKVCSKTCDSECPEGWTCQLVSGGSDGQYVCVSNFASLCLPCESAEGCAAEAPTACVEYPDGVSFCGGACDLDKPCPGGYSCQEVTTTTGAEIYQCVADTGTCSCSALAIGSGLATGCSNENEYGACEGLRVCGEDGLGECDAGVPAEEICNGLDDDCDGEADEGTCDDGNACTQDSCGGVEGCLNTPLDEGECLDGDACTIGDHCEAGACVGTTIDCDDKNSCTEDSCNDLGGCSSVPIAALCDDADPCTVGDICKEGVCIGSVALSCDDGNPCTDDSCGAEGCVFTANDVACDDGNACTTGDTCAEGQCGYESLVACDDGNVCTTDSCDPATGCVSANNEAPCDDANACTVGDTCTDGACASGAASTCADGNPCTDDSCDEVSGCAFTANSADCDDKNACTTTDVCSGGACTGTSPLACDDANICTDDSCDPLSGCITTANTAPCDDGNACTVGDLCGDGACASGDAATCADGNPCTDDSCDAQNGCLFEANTEDCDDKNACTTMSVCTAGACLGSSPLACDDGDVCTADSCSPSDGCVTELNEAPCDDGDVCTSQSVCDGGECAGVKAFVCDDGNPCTDDSCDVNTGCVFSYNEAPCEDGGLCTAKSQCSAGQCAVIELVECDDDNTCTDDLCVPASGCIHPSNVAPCDDGEPCTTDDACSDGTCEGGAPKTCDDGLFCNGEESCTPGEGCVAGAPPVLDDNISCTSDLCDEVQDKVLHVGNNEVCSTDKLCTAAICDVQDGCQEETLADCCGNNLVEGDEDCDDGNSIDNDDCTAQCKKVCAGLSYDGLCLRYQIVNSQAFTPSCEPVVPNKQWVQADFESICTKVTADSGNEAGCNSIDTDQDGGQCENHAALVSWELNGSPDVWVNKNAFSFDPTSGNNDNCKLVDQVPTLIVYACADENPDLGGTYSNGLGGFYDTNSDAKQTNAKLACESHWGVGNCCNDGCGSCNDKGYHKCNTANCNGSTYWNYFSMSQAMDCGWVDPNEILVSGDGKNWTQ
jgi:hypothetical protein